MYNGFEYQGNILEVREDRFPHPSALAAGGGRGGFGGGGRGGGYMGRGGYHGASHGAYNDPYGGNGAAVAAFGAGAFAGLPFGPRGLQPYNGGAPIAPSTQIYVRNVSRAGLANHLSSLLFHLTNATLAATLVNRQ